MSEHTIHLTVPDDLFTSRAEVALWAPPDMTPDRFREIARIKGARLGVSCYQLSPKYGPVLMATYEESGCKVVMRGPVDDRERDEQRKVRRLARRMQSGGGFRG